MCASVVRVFRWGRRFVWWLRGGVDDGEGEGDGTGGDGDGAGDVGDGAGAGDGDDGVPVVVVMMARMCSDVCGAGE